MKAQQLWLLGLLLIGCSEDTGSGLVSFAARASGPKKATGAPYEFESSLGYRVTLERARLTVGALYLNRARPVLGSQDTPCVLTGLYSAQVRAGVVFDALSSEKVAFDEPGEGTADRALTGEVWLTGGDINAAQDNTKILDFSGTATKSDRVFGFHGIVTIGPNRALGSADPATPGANPICKQRIVTPIAVDITPSPGGTLGLRVKPEVWFDQVDFARLPGAVGEGEDLEIPDSRDNAASLNLFQGLRSIDAYEFDWET